MGDGKGTGERFTDVELGLRIGRAHRDALAIIDDLRQRLDDHHRDASSRYGPDRKCSLCGEVIPANLDADDRELDRRELDNLQLPPGTLDNLDHRFPTVVIVDSPTGSFPVPPATYDPSEECRRRLEDGV